MKNKSKVETWPVEAKAGLALVLTSAVIVGGALIIGSNFSSKNNPDDIANVPSSVVPTSDTNPTSTPNSEVDVKIETFNKPFTVETKCERYFYDLNDPSEVRVKAIVPVPNKKSSYMKSVGVDYTYDGKVFDVVSATSGVVSEKITDSIYGNMIVVKHESGLETIYASLGNITVNEGDELKQGDLIGKSGESLYTTGLGSCLHFEVLKDKVYLNPEKTYTLEVEKI